MDTVCFILRLQKKVKNKNENNNIAGNGASYEKCWAVTTIAHSDFQCNTSSERV